MGHILTFLRDVKKEEKKIRQSKGWLELGSRSGAHCNEEGLGLALIPGGGVRRREDNTFNL